MQEYIFKSRTDERTEALFIQCDSLWFSASVWWVITSSGPSTVRSLTRSIYKPWIQKYAHQRHTKSRHEHETRVSVSDWNTDVWTPAIWRRRRPLRMNMNYREVVVTRVNRCLLSGWWCNECTVVMMSHTTQSHYNVSLMHHSFIHTQWQWMSFIINSKLTLASRRGRQLNYAVEDCFCHGIKN